GFKFLLQNSLNLCDFTTLLKPKLAPQVDFAHAVVLGETFIAPDFRHLESDLLVRAPLLPGGEPEVAVDLYFLVEHQSEPERFAVVRALRYLMSAFELQQRQWLETHPNLDEFNYHPVLPVVLYSGSRSWPRLTPIDELVLRGHLIKEHLPRLKPVFFNLAA